MFKLRNFFGLLSQQEKINKYKSLQSELKEIGVEATSLADSYSIYKSTDWSTADNIEKYNTFLDKHKKDVVDLCNRRARIEKSIEKIEKDPSCAGIIKEIREIDEIKALYKSQKISPRLFVDLLKAKEGTVRFADVLVWKDGKLLILQRVNENGGHSDKWCIPGGHVDVGEDFREAAKRELYEETGIDVPVSILHETGKYKAKGVEIHYYTVYLDSPEVNFDSMSGLIRVDSSEESGSAWICKEDIDKYDFIFDMKANLKKLLGMDEVSVVADIIKAYSEGKISEDIFKRCVKGREIDEYEISVMNIEKAMTTEETKPVEKESLDEEEKDIKKNDEVEYEDEEVDEETEANLEKSQFTLSIDFNDIDQADMFKSMVEDLHSQGKIDIESIEKARKGEPIGTEKTWGGKQYIKTANGWRPKKGNTSTTPKPEGDKAKQRASFTDVLKDEDGKKLIEAIEYVLREAEKGNKDKQSIVEGHNEELKKKFNYDMFHGEGYPWKKKGDKKSTADILKKGVEADFVNREGDESVFVRVYDDGSVKVQGSNIHRLFKNADEAGSFLDRNGFSKK